jgi:hypothetical protein
MTAELIEKQQLTAGMRNCRLVGSLNFGSYIWLNRGKGSFRLRIRQQRLAREPLHAMLLLLLR